MVLAAHVCWGEQHTCVGGNHEFMQPAWFLHSCCGLMTIPLVEWMNWSLNQSRWWFQPPWKNISQNGNLPQVGVKMKNIWNHHLVIIHVSHKRCYHLTPIFVVLHANLGPVFHLPPTKSPPTCQTPTFSLALASTWIQSCIDPDAFPNGLLCRIHVVQQKGFWFNLLYSQTKIEQDYHCTAQSLKWLYGFRTTLVSLVSWVFVAAFRSFPEGGNYPFLVGQPGPMLQGILLIVFWDHLCASDWFEWLEPTTWRWHVTPTSC